MSAMMKFFVLLFVLACSVGCASIPEYQKMYLNDQDMQLSDDNIQTFESNFHTYREGASGATGGNQEAMRMQLTGRVILLSSILLLVGSLLAQDTTFAGADTAKIDLDDIEINFLSSYYTQDGNHSPVTGGIGTEYLTNFAPSLNVVIPIDTSRTVIFDGGVDFYSSASSDNIDNPYVIPDHISGASSNDERTYVSALLKKKLKKKLEIGYLLGTSLEWDVFSYYGGLSLGMTSKDNNRGLDLKVSYYYDDWKLIYPVELRNGNVQYLNEDKRQSGEQLTDIFRELVKETNSLYCHKIWFFKADCSQLLFIAFTSLIRKGRSLKYSR